jgi:hypothetical protein
VKSAFPKGAFWSRLGFLYAIVNLGLSQISFNAVRGNVDQFPKDLVFYLLVLFWFQLLPLVLFLLLDLFTERVFQGGKGFIIWRCCLCLFLAVSLLRQFQVLDYEKFRRLLFLPEPFVYAIPGVVVVWVCHRWFRHVQTYLALFGATSLILTVLFLQHGRMVGSPPAPVAKNANPGAPVFMIVFDELSYQMLVKDGRIDRASFPNFAELASGGLWFTNATANHMATEMSLPSIFTGRRFPEPKETPSLFERLPRGYRVRVVETEVMVENWLRNRGDRNIENFQGKSRFLIRHPFYSVEYMVDLAYRPLLGRMQFMNAGMSVIVFQSVNTRTFHLTLSEEMSSFLGSVNAQRAPSQFSFWHASIPHSPFFFNADGSIHSDVATYFSRERKLSSAQSEAVMDNYRSQVKFADLVLGKFMDRLKKENLYDKAIVAVCADHGLRTWGDFYSHVDLTARIPLILHGPGIAPAVSDLDVQLIDLAPTLLDLLKAPYRPSDFEGVSIFAPSRPERQKILHSYPADVAYNAKTGSWESVNKENKPKDLASAISSSLNQKKDFSAVQVQADLFAAREEGQDFLTFYLSRHFPESVSEEQLETIRTQAKNADSLADTPSNNFRRGSYYFFVALAETQRISQGRPEDPSVVQAHWETTLALFKKTGGLLPWMAEEIVAILKQADGDEDHKLTKEELAGIITSHQY